MILCVVCKTNESMTQKGPGAPLCRACRAEVTLTSEDPKIALAALDAMFAAEKGKVTMAVKIEDEVLKTVARAIRCERCGRAEVYSPNDKKTSFFCDECGKQLCRECAALCLHKDFAGPKVLCTDCRAEKSLTGQPVEDYTVELPQKSGEVVHPHCGRTTCVGQPGDPDPWCDCACKKCRAAVGSGHPAPMFGKMTPDPDPEPEQATPVDQKDLDDEMEAYRREAEQA
jgi:hypothetical protein